MRGVPPGEQNVCLKVVVRRNESRYSPTNLRTTYDTIGEAARALNIPRESISCFVKNNQQKPYKGRYVFTKL
jgi:hypothetical protein